MTMLSYNVIDDVVREILCTQEVARKKQEKKNNKEKDSDEIYGDSRLRESPTRLKFVTETNW